jgi:hypothetical protein
MPDFTVIEGGGQGPPDWKSSYARQAFRKLAVEMLRAIARGDDPEARIIRSINEFIRYASEASTSPRNIIDKALGSFFEEGLHQEFDGSSSDERKPILEHGLRVLAESLADDPAAKGRRSKRETALIQAIESYVVELYAGHHREARGMASPTATESNTSQEGKQEEVPARPTLIASASHSSRIQQQAVSPRRLRS